MLAATPALYLLALACPISMGLMMVFMGKGMMGGKTRNQSAPETDDEQQPLAALKEEQSRLAAKIATLEREAAEAVGPDREQSKSPEASIEQQRSEPTSA